ncbi:hypothetical protein [Jiangella rhizosphaerae]|uniref:Uncharacterized protein n=1 Tax=Jiangella rhizosphaerae TaxID=2293569 RepID=A0A418KX00_9ACTN|nr:hypothetical protein [Jiangella rhizosphaerae]RIQ36938.1 hypothetical protein DY240_01450 [Jiangella rhizosphaerae]
MSMLARVPRSRTTEDMDLAAQHAQHLTEAERTHRTWRQLLAAAFDADVGAVVVTTNAAARP